MADENFGETVVSHDVPRVVLRGVEYAIAFDTGDGDDIVMIAVRAGSAADVRLAGLCRLHRMQDHLATLAITYAAAIRDYAELLVGSTDVAARKMRATAQGMGVLSRAIHSVVFAGDPNVKMSVASGERPAEGDAPAPPSVH